MPPFRRLPLVLQLGEILRYGGAVALHPMLWVPALTIATAVLYSEPDPVHVLLPPALWAGYGTAFLLWFTAVIQVVNPALRRHLAGRPGPKPTTHSQGSQPIPAATY